MDETQNRKLREEFVGEIRKRMIGPSAPDEELLERPNKRYLSGMVFPQGATAASNLSEESQDAEDASNDEEEIGIESPTDLLFQKLPASVGMTFAISEKEETLNVCLSAATYLKAAAQVIGTFNQDERSEGRKNNKTHTVWKRSHLPADAEEESVELSIPEDAKKPKAVLGGRAELLLHVRMANGHRIATIALINSRKTPEDKPVDIEDILFQVNMKCTPRMGICAYPDPPRISPDPEAEELSLQYRELPAFAVGHGCGVYWPDAVNSRVPYVSVDFLPAVEVPPVTTDIQSLSESVKDALSIVRLQDGSFNPLPAFRELIAEYNGWRDRIASEPVEPRFDGPRLQIIARIDEIIDRMRDGVDLLENDPRAREIFRLANRAMMINIARSNSNRVRRPGEKFYETDFSRLDPGSISWRPFQIAFILISLRGLWEPSHADRSIVDLIWFPTGGGKTEAYLGVAAFEIIRRRLEEGPSGRGTAVIKRYTLRLLTIQQFERAGGLICALETMRQNGEINDSHPFSLGLWVGQDSAPNDGKAALKDFDRILSTTGKVDGVKIPLKHCPVCSTPIVPHSKTEGPVGVGIRKKGDSIELFCPSSLCPYHGGLPISFVDEDLYAAPPTLLLGTVDKFAMLAWRDDARAFFGTDSNTLPPSLIIQDELHLISGPLGTLAGIYEAAIDSIISERGRPAKYICATATIRRSDDQILKLYGRKGALFPPAGISAADSFFSRTSTDSPGRLYIGAMGQGHTPTFSNVIASSALLSAGGDMRTVHGDVVDTWWTVVAYHNSKRELGKSLSLARDDIPARMKSLGETRSVASGRVSELSANLRDSEIPEALHRLSIGLPESATLDFVACTNMLSVGVDISRLGLMMVNGQPKTVSEYIQASSRVGRDRKRPPGIVFALFSPTKPRDRSHYEFFRHFHKAYYRHVEPTSVTPFALPAQERGLHGAFIALVRMVSDISKNNHASSISSHIKQVRALEAAFLARIAAAGDGDIHETRARLEDFISYWINEAAQHGKNLRFQSGGKQNAGLIRPFKSQGYGGGWETLQSLRNVDVPLRLVVPTNQLMAKPAH